MHGHHDHGHDHHLHGEGHAPARFDRAFAIGAALNAAFVAAEVAGGLAAHSVSLLADAAHNLGDVLGLLLAWTAAWASRRPPSSRRTYGWGRTSILAALINASVLLAGVGAIGLEAVQRLLAPAPIGTGIVMAIAAAGIAVNGGTALLFMRGRAGDLNVRAAFSHLAADAAVSFGVVVSALLIGITGWLWLDPVTSLGIVALIVIGTWGILRDSANLAVDSVPAGLDTAEVSAAIAALPGVEEVHDLHIWALSTTENALTAHVVAAEERRAGLLEAVCAELRNHHGIGHATVQVETRAEAQTCRLRPDTVV